MQNISGFRDGISGIVMSRGRHGFDGNVESLQAGRGCYQASLNR